MSGGVSLWNSPAINFCNDSGSKGFPVSPRTAFARIVRASASMLLPLRAARSRKRLRVDSGTFRIFKVAMLAMIALLAFLGQPSRIPIINLSLCLMQGHNS